MSNFVNFCCDREVYSPIEFPFSKMCKLPLSLVVPWDGLKPVKT